MRKRCSQSFEGSTVPRSKINCFAPTRHSLPRAKVPQWAALKNAVPGWVLTAAEKVPQWVLALLAIDPLVNVLPVIAPPVIAQPVIVQPVIAQPVIVQPVIAQPQIDPPRKPVPLVRPAPQAMPVPPPTPVPLVPQVSAPPPLPPLIVTVVPSAVAVRAVPAPSLKNSPRLSSQTAFFVSQATTVFTFRYPVLE